MSRDASTFSVYSLVSDVAQIAQVHRRPGLIDALREVLNGRAVFQDCFNPIVLEGVRQLADHSKDVAEAMK
jgi:hypothetical protein